MQIYILLKPNGDDKSDAIAASHDLQHLKAFAEHDAGVKLEWSDEGECATGFDPQFGCHGSNYPSHEYDIELVPVVQGPIANTQCANSEIYVG